jgi:hypothetical protein
VHARTEEVQRDRCGAVGEHELDGHLPASGQELAVDDRAGEDTVVGILRRQGEDVAAVERRLRLGGRAAVEPEASATT